MSVWKTPSTGGSGGLCTEAPLAPLHTKPLPIAMPLQSSHLATPLCSTLPLRSSSQAVSGPRSWRCCCTQKPRPCGSAVMALGQQGGVGNSSVGLALRGGTGLGFRLARVRPSSSVRDFRVCASAAGERIAGVAASDAEAVRNCLLSIYFSLFLVAQSKADGHAALPRALPGRRSYGRNTITAGVPKARNLPVNFGTPSAPRRKVVTLLALWLSE